MLWNPGPGCSPLRSRQRSQLGERKACFILGADILVVGGAEGLSKHPLSPLDSQVAQRVGACPNACPPHWTVRWCRRWVPIQMPALPTGQSGGAEGGCLSKFLPSPLDSQLAQRVGACPNAHSPHWTVRWHRGWVPVQAPALPTGPSGGRTSLDRGTQCWWTSH